MSSEAFASRLRQHGSNDPGARLQCRIGATVLLLIWINKTILMQINMSQPARWRKP